MCMIPLGAPLYNDDPTTYDALNTIVTLQSHPTGTPDLYYYETSFDKFTYITERIVNDSAGNKLGYFFIISNPKKYSSDALFPSFLNNTKETTRKIHLFIPMRFIVRKN